LEETSRAGPQPLAQSKVSWSNSCQAGSGWIFNTSMDGVSAASLVLFDLPHSRANKQTNKKYTHKKCCCLCYNVHCFNLSLVPLALSFSTTRKYVPPHPTQTQVR